MLAWWTSGNNRSYTETSAQRTVLGSQTPSFLLGLADPVNSADGLQLVGRVEDRLHQQHVSRFDDVQTVGAGVQREEEDVDLFIVFEGAQILLENFELTHSERSERNLQVADMRCLSTGRSLFKKKNSIFSLSISMSAGYLMIFGLDLYEMLRRDALGRGGGEEDRSGLESSVIFLQAKK